MAVDKRYTVNINGVGITFATSTNIHPEQLFYFLQQNMEQNNIVKHSKDSSTLNTQFINAMYNFIPLLHTYDATTKTNNTDCEQTEPCESRNCLYVFKTPRGKATVFDKHWRDHFQELVEFKQKFGHSNVSRTTPGYDQLGSWLADQRKKLRRGKLTREQYGMLTTLGVNWDPANISNMTSLSVTAQTRGAQT
mmetsp:Transcript_6632/g.9186  ORF Transcript_6632/g.9186 Transcript_6632/m.9186 type:complete len:193 (+) Transcript_6632:102-680(+)